MNDQTDHLEPRVARIEGEVGQIASSVERMVKSVEALSEKVERKTTPDRGRDIAVVGVFLSFLGMVAWAGVRESDQLDIRLQREMRQTNETTLERVNAVDNLSQHRYSELAAIAHANQGRLARLEEHEWDEVKADREELRKLRGK